jgi:CRP/FNR family transcriptional regulator, cyclic AMP receptor protein
MKIDTHGPLSLYEPVAATGAAWLRVARPEVRALVELDPDLAGELPPDRRQALRNRVRVRVITLQRGAWPIDALRTTTAGHLGILIVDGLLARELLADDAASMELLGPGDVLRPWDESADSGLLQAVVRWSALAPTRVAILDRQLARTLAEFPEIHSSLLERFADRTRRLAVLQAISQLNRVDRRVVTLLWHLAERWGRVTPDGVAVPLVLSHRMLGQLVGARRPTISSAVGSLMRTGEVVRRDDGTWLLTGTPVGAPDARTSRFVAPRRATLAAAG